MMTEKSQWGIRMSCFSVIYLFLFHKEKLKTWNISCYLFFFSIERGYGNFLRSYLSYFQYPFCHIPDTSKIQFEYFLVMDPIVN